MPHHYREMVFIVAEFYLKVNIRLSVSRLLVAWRLHKLLAFLQRTIGGAAQIWNTLYVLCSDCSDKIWNTLYICMYHYRELLLCCHVSHLVILHRHFFPNLQTYPVFIRLTDVFLVRSLRQGQTLDTLLFIRRILRWRVETSRMDCQDQDLIRLRQIKFHVVVRALMIKFYILHSP